MSGDELPRIDQLAEEFLDRLRRGEKPTVQELVDRHPELEDELRELLPTLAFMEEFKPRESDRQESPSEGVVEPETAPQQIGDVLKGPWYESAQLVILKYGPDFHVVKDIDRLTAVARE